MVKYQEIANEIRQRIKMGLYPVDTLIPDQITLAKEFNVSRMTMKKALDILAMEGLIYRQRGAGTFVMKNALAHPLDAPAKEYEGLTKQLKEQQLTSQVIYFNIEFPSQEVMEQLMLKESQPVYKIIRLRSVNQEPYVIEHTYMPADIVTGLTEDVLLGSIYEYLKEELGFVFGGAYRKIHADKASEYDQKYLECGEHDPVLEVEQLVYLKDGRPFEYSRSRHRYDKRSYTVLEVSNNS